MVVGILRGVPKGHVACSWAVGQRPPGTRPYEEEPVDGIRKERRGFASMSIEKQREIASKGGRAAHEKGTAHEWTAEEARNAGRKGGQISRGGRGRLIVPPSTSGDANISVMAPSESGRAS